MSRSPETLRRLVQTRIDELGLSVRETARRAKGLASYESINLIVRGKHSGRITDRVAEGLAAALEVPLSRVYAAADLTQPGEPWEWPRRFDRLLPEHRAIVEQVAAGFLSAYENREK